MARYIENPRERALYLLMRSSYKSTSEYDLNGKPSGAARLGVKPLTNAEMSKRYREKKKRLKENVEVT